MQRLIMLSVLVFIVSGCTVSAQEAQPPATTTIPQETTTATGQSVGEAIPTATLSVATILPTDTAVLPDNSQITPEQLGLGAPHLYLPIIVRGLPQPQPLPPTPTPIPNAPDPPDPLPYTYSYYIQFNNTETACAWGAFSRNRGDQGVAILAFGAPRDLRSNPDLDPLYGVRFVPPEPGLVLPSVTFDGVRTLAEAFARGYMEGCNTLPLEEDVRDPVLLIVIGTNNARITVEGALEDNPFLLETGDDWISMVKEFQDFLIISGYGPELRTAYGYDAEAPSSGPEWSDRTHSLKWVQDAELENNVSIPYVFYGDANRAPRLEAKNDWSPDHVVALEEIYNIAWGEARLPRPIPQIYSWAYAQEWYNVRRYAQEEQNDSINIYGILTSCVGVPENVCLVGDERNWQEVDIDPNEEILTPEQAWEAMYQIHNAPRSPSNESVTLRPVLNQVLMTDLIYQGASAPGAGTN